MNMEKNKIYLYNINNTVEAFINKEEAKTLYGYDNPDMILSVEEFERNDSLARVVNGNIILGKTEEEKTAEIAHQKREIRDSMLAETDKYVLSDYPINSVEKNKILKYRTYLRDITINKDFPYLEILSLSTWLDN